ncbi:MAG: haloacid dehalogenase-like hydrolase, partial [Kutzneria sp.]|nr:haloacid dehalogenase-like hydrolase [Kutzneria sp.]
AGFGRAAMARAFQKCFGSPPTEQVPMAGRTDRAILAELLAQRGTDGEHRLAELQTAAAEAAEETAEQLCSRGGRALPGAKRALAALSGRRDVVQSVLTGNLRRIGLVKLRVLELAGHLDLEVGAFGDEHLVRAHLVDTARTLAGAKYGHGFAGRTTVLVGDTPLDVAAARASGATAVAVASGQYSAEELTAAGADTVLADLTDTDDVVAAVLGDG